MCVCVYYNLRVTTKRKMLEVPNILSKNSYQDDVELIQ